MYNNLKKYTYISILVFSILSSLLIINDLIKEAIKGILIPFVIALIISYFLSPMTRFIQNKLKLKSKTITILIVFIITLIILGLFFTYIASFLYSQIVDFVKNDLEIITNWLNNRFDTDIFAQIQSIITDLFSFDSFIAVASKITSMFNVLISSVLVVVFLFFILRDGEKISLGIIDILPIKIKEDVFDIVNKSHVIISKYFSTQFILIFIMWIFYSIFFSFVMPIPRAIMFAFVLASLDLIPYIGPTIGLILPLLYVITSNGDIYYSILLSFCLVLGINVIGQLLESNLFQPFLMSKAFDMHPMLVLVCLLFFGKLLGVLGIIIAIPLSGIIKVIYLHFSNNN